MDDLQLQTSPIIQIIKESYALERKGDIGSAFQRAEEALDLARTLGDFQVIDSATVCLAYIHYHLGHFPESQILAKEVLIRTDSKTRSQADALRILGDCAHEAGELDKAEEYYHRAVDFGRQLGYHYILHRCLHSLSACVYIPRGQFELALAADEESLRLAIDIDMLDEAWLPLITMGWVYWITGKTQRAHKVVEEMECYVQPGSLAEGYRYCLKADLAQEENPESALSLYSQARSIAETLGDPGLNAELRVGLSRYYRVTGNNAAAFDWANDALSIADRAGCLDVHGWALVERGRACWASGDTIQAEADIRAAIQLFASYGASYDLARSLLLLTALLYEQGRNAGPVWLETVSRIVSNGYSFVLERERALAFPLLSVFLNSKDEHIAAISASLLDHLANIPPPPLSIITLGRFEVKQGIRMIPDQLWRRRKAGELFRLLLFSSGHSLFRDQVVEAFWPDKSPDSTPSLFHQATSALRRVLEPDLPDKFPSRYLEVDEGRITLRLPPGSYVDFQVFVEHVQKEEWQAALALYQGELSPDDRYSHWAAPVRERLKLAAIQAALGEVQRLVKLGDYKGALDRACQALELEPWQEEAVFLGMQSCVAMKDRTRAIRLYLDLEKRLREELGITPQAEIRNYYKSLL